MRRQALPPFTVPALALPLLPLGGVCFDDVFSPVNCVLRLVSHQLWLTQTPVDKIPMMDALSEESPLRLAHTPASSSSSSSSTDRLRQDRRTQPLYYFGGVFFVVIATVLGTGILGVRRNCRCRVCARATVCLLTRSAAAATFAAPSAAEPRWTDALLGFFYHQLVYVRW